MPTYSRDLCALADVTKLVPGYTAGTDTNTDATLSELITEQSRDAMESTGREFKSITDPATPSTRSFDVLDTWNVNGAGIGSTVWRRKLHVGDMAGPVTAVSTVDAQGNAVETVSASNYVLLPRVREDWQPYSTIWFPPNCSQPAQIYSGYVISVTATWGYVSVPTTVKDAVARLVIVRYLNDVTAQGTQFADAANRADFNVAASIRQALTALERHRVPTF